MLSTVVLLVATHGWQIAVPCGVVAACLGIRRYGRHHERETQERLNPPTVGLEAADQKRSPHQ